MDLFSLHKLASQKSVGLGLRSGTWRVSSHDGYNALDDLVKSTITLMTIQFGVSLIWQF